MHNNVTKDQYKSDELNINSIIKISSNLLVDIQLYGFY